MRLVDIIKSRSTQSGTDSGRKPGFEPGVRKTEKVRGGSTSRVLIKTDTLRNDIKGLVPVDVIKTDGDMLTVRIGREVKSVDRSDTIPLAGPRDSQIIKMPTPARGAFGKF